MRTSFDDHPCPGQPLLRRGRPSGDQQQHLGTRRDDTKAAAEPDWRLNHRHHSIASLTESYQMHRRHPDSTRCGRRAWHTIAALPNEALLDEQMPDRPDPHNLV